MKTEYVVIEQGKNIIIKEKEGVMKNGDPRFVRVSNFKGKDAGANALNYLEQKLSIRKGT